MFSLLLVTVLTFIANAQSGPVNEELIDVNVVGGHVVNIEDYPFQVSITDSDGYWCTGSILTRYHVLTAGHCVRFGSPPILIRAGSSFFLEGGSEHHIESSVSFQGVSNYDMGIFRVQEPFVFDKTRQPIEIADKGVDPKPGTVGVLSGWGDTNVERLSAQLRAVKLPVIDREVCDKIFNGSKIGDIIDGQFCAGYLEGGKDGCVGDSGGPFVVNGKIVGVMSMGLGCARKNAPGVYAQVSFFYDWIHENTKN